MQVPFESLKRVSRDRKYVIDDLQSLVNAVKALAEKQCSAQERAQDIQSLTERCEHLKRQVDG